VRYRRRGDLSRIEFLRDLLCFVGATHLSREAKRMAVILVFIGFVIIGDAINMGISSVVERYSENGSLMTFLALFVGVFIVAWQLAVWVTERYIIRTPQVEEPPRTRSTPSQQPVQAR
jgi:hypothetical protein